MDQEYEAHKWVQIAAALRAETDESYTTEFLKKQAKELDAAGGLAGLSEGEKAVGEKDKVEEQEEEEEEAQEGDDNDAGKVKTEEGSGEVEGQDEEMEIEAV